jgi:hypothetical protein
MQSPVYKFYPGQIIYVQRNVEENTLYKTHVVQVFEDIFPNDERVRIIVTRTYNNYKKRWYYTAYREIEASQLMYWHAKEYCNHGSGIAGAIRKYEINYVWDYGKDGRLEVIPEDKWNIKRFDRKKRVSSKHT